MSSIHRQKGRPHFFCAFYDWDSAGNPVRRFKSTKSSNRKEAAIICDAWAKTAVEAKRGRMSPDRARAVIESGVADILDAHGINMPTHTVSEFLNSWLLSKGGSSGTRARYKGIVTAFCDHLGPKAKQSLQSLHERDIVTFRDKLAAHLAAGTVNLQVKVIRMALNRAVKSNLLSRNPALGVDSIEGDRHRRRPFTLPELKLILDGASTDLKTLILTGLYTGLRAGDCANLTAANLDLLKSEFTLTEQKTGKTRTIEIAKPLLRHVESLDLGDDPAAPLCPSLYGKRSGWISNCFYDLLASVGLVPVRNHKSKARGRSAARQQSALSFHSLRHTAVSLLKNAGVSDVIARDIIGHDSAAVSRQYTHIESKTKRKALNKLPDVLKK